MENVNTYSIDLNSLKQDVCEFDYVLEDTFFQREESEELRGGKCSAKVNVARVGDAFSLNISVEGTVRLVCDRCLDLVEMPINCYEELVVKIGAGEETDSIVYVSPINGVLDLAWLMYELVVINLPVVHSHRPGECNPRMEELLLSHLCTLAEDDNDDNV
ncbi:MAG: DUF177 domain-containing protein [Paludibacter sp.]|nr:DUF177 domain-containing protein [Bacteroidales bacterium]MCM1068968.1 DUF177 domain-containing protein [Prevotella sp.]MCM1353631.1 DUF177 domain-containing protein [Bacteroides sp.]MCM1442020.1 DUF177 domain-containing protein [Muribaculum sp.]MCM1481524.1 DUF177 domain-containing protein [Paludibacter sp.]